MATTRLDLSFRRLDGGNSKISIDDARSDVTEAEVNSLMDLIIANEIFQPNGSPLAEKVKIELVSTDTVEFTVL